MLCIIFGLILLLLLMHLNNNKLKKEHFSIFDLFDPNDPSDQVTMKTLRTGLKIGEHEKKLTSGVSAVFGDQWKKNMDNKVKVEWITGEIINIMDKLHEGAPTGVSAGPIFEQSNISTYDPRDFIPFKTADQYKPPIPKSDGTMLASIQRAGGGKYEIGNDAEDTSNNVNKLIEVNRKRPVKCKF